MKSMSAITWLHLSDLQFSTSRTYDTNVVLRALLRDIEKRLEWYSLQPDLIAVTGDIAFSGKPVEYGLAQEFFDELLETTSLSKARLFLVPGNHDVDRELISPGARNIGSSLTDRETVNGILASAGDRQLMFARLGSYTTFVNDYLGEYLPFDKDRFFYVRVLDLLGRRVALLGLNSAWLSTSDQDEAEGIVIGERQVRAALALAADADLKIALMHHPFDQLREFDREEVEPMLSDGCDFVLHGHVHRTNVLSLSGPGTKAMVVAAGARQAVRRYPNSYNFVQLNLAASTGSVYLRRYSDERGGFWTRDALTYRNASTGRYSFRLAIGEPDIELTTLQPGDEIRSGQYHIVSCIHEGGMATVWLAEQPEFGGRKVAVKEPKLEKQHRQELERRFRQEIELAPQLERLPHVVRTYTLEHRTDGTPLLVMEYVDGGSLADLISRNPDGLPIGQALKFTQDMLEALKGLHQLPDTPVHRDIKPGNILLDRERGALLSDFGLTQLPGKSRRSESRAKSHPGTPLYMAPEQEQSTVLLTPAADLYALGCVLFEMLTGERYKRLTPGTKASEIRPEVPEWLDRVLVKALAEDMWARYQSAEEMAKALEPRVSWPAGYVLEGKYEIQAKITTTGKCEIYQAQERRYARQTVAIKRLKPDRLLEKDGLEPGEAHARFEREIAILRQIEHRYVLRLLDEGGATEDGDRYLVTQFADKGSLREYLQAKPGNRLEPVEALEIAKAIAQGIGAIHRLGIIHRDIKPSNVFLFSDHDGYAIKLADFSISKVPRTWLVHETITQVDAFLGTVLYSAPEQLVSELDNPRSDLYAWAAVFFETLAGASLVQSLTGDSEDLSFMALLKYYRTSRDQELPAPFFTERGVPQELVPILQKALRKDPESRYQSAEELQRDLAHAQETLATSGAKAEACYRLGMERWVSGELQDAIEQFEQIPPGTNEFFEVQPALVKLYDQLGNRYFTTLRFIRAIKSWSSSDRIQRDIKDSVDES
jgi:serine/threonine protein kinase/predicted MPP superfamily phosphohydrolase